MVRIKLVSYNLPINGEFIGFLEDMGRFFGHLLVTKILGVVGYISIYE